MNYIKRLYRGRVNRKFYAMGFLLFLTPFMLLLGFLYLLPPELVFGSNFTLSILGLFWIVFMVYFVSLHVRRFHDLGSSGWKALLLILPLINLITLIYLLLSKSSEVKNEYGDPVSVDAKFFDVIFV